MANFQQFGVTRGDVVQINAQEYLIAGRVEDDSGAVLADFTGPAALRADFGGVFATLGADQLLFLLNDLGVAQAILAMKAGVQ